MADENLSFQDSSHGVSSLQADWNDAAIFAQGIYSPNDIGYVVQGMDFTPDFSQDTLTVSEGWAKVYKAQNTTNDHTTGDGSGQGPKSLLDSVHPAQISERTGIVLGSGTVNHIWLTINLSTGDSINVFANEGATPQLPHVKLGTVDTANETYDDSVNRLPEGLFEYLESKTAKVTSAPTDPEDVFRLDDFHLTDVSDDGTTLVTDSEEINLGYGLGGTDEGGGTVTVEKDVIDGVNGTSTQSGDGSTKYSIAHGLSSTPEYVNVKPKTEDAAADTWYSYDGTYIHIYYATAPPTGTDNLVWQWAAFPHQGQDVQEIDEDHTGDAITPDSVDTGELSVGGGSTLTDLFGNNLSQTSGVLEATDTQLSDEGVQDIVSGVLSGSGSTTISYDDSNNVLTISSTDTDTHIDVQANGSTVGTDVSGLDLGSNLSGTSNPDGSVTIDGTDTQLSDEEVQDVVGPFLSGGSNVTVSYDDSNDVLTIESTDTDTQLSTEDVQDIVGPFVNGGTNVSVNYDDGNNTLTISATDTNTQAFSVAASGSTTLSSGSETADTGVATDSNHYDVNINPGAADIAVSLDGSGSNYVIHIEENTTSVGNPTVDWQLVRSEL